MHLPDSAVEFRRGHQNRRPKDPVSGPLKYPRSRSLGPSSWDKDHDFGYFGGPGTLTCARAPARPARRNRPSAEAGLRDDDALARKSRASYWLIEPKRDSTQYSRPAKKDQRKRQLNECHQVACVTLLHERGRNLWRHGRWMICVDFT